MICDTFPANGYSANCSRWCFGALFAFSVAPIWAADLSTVFEQARSNDASLLAAQAAATAKRENLPIAKSQMYPNIAFSNSRNLNRLSATAPNFLGQSVTNHDGYLSGNMALSLRQPLYRPALKYAVDQAGFSVKEADAMLDSEYQNLSNKVVGNYFEALFAIDHLRLIESQKIFLTAQLDAAQRSLVAGNGTRTDIDEARARLDMTLAQELEARQNIQYTRSQLEMLTQVPLGALSALVPERLNLQAEARDLSSWMEAAEAQSPDIRTLKARVEQARIEISRAGSGHKPTLDASAQWSLSKSENLTAITSRYNTKAIGVSLNVPIYGGGYVSAQVRQATAELERLEQVLEAGRRDLRLRVHAEYRNITEGVLKIRAQEQAVHSTAQLVDSAKKSKIAGSRTQIDVLNAEQLRGRAEDDLARARYAYIISLVKLWAMTGDADAAQIAKVNAWLETPNTENRASQ